MNINTTGIAIASVLNKHINISSNEISSGYSKLLSVVLWVVQYKYCLYNFYKQGKLQTHTATCGLLTFSYV